MRYIRPAIFLALVCSMVVGCGTGGGGGPVTSIIFSLSGTITDSTNGAPVAGATVSVSSTSGVLGTAATNAAGDYALTNLSSTSSTVTWSVAAATYRSFSTSLTVSNGAAYDVDYAMARQVGAVSGSVSAAPTMVAPVRTLIGPTAGRARRIDNLPVYIPDRILVKPRASAQLASMQALHREVGGQLIKTLPKLNVQVIKLAPGTPAAAAIARYRASGLVEYAEQDVFYYTLATPNDQFYSVQWHYPAINLPSAWDLTTGSAGVIVAVVDTGIRSHPDLNGITVQGRDVFDGDNDPTDPGCSVDPNALGHGMHVTGTIAALTNNSIGVAGVNWGATSGTRIMPIRALGEFGGQCGVGSSADIADGIVYAADHGAKVVNLSIGGQTGDLTLQNAVNYAVGLGVVLVAAAGNDGIAVDFPAAYPNVIAVAASGCSNVRAYYSSVGPEVDVTAPGGDDTVVCGGDPNTSWVWSPSWTAASGNAYYGVIGTSMSTPHVSGLVALMISRGIVGPSNIQTTLQNTATDLGSPGRDDLYGHGLVNASAAVGGGTAATRLRAFSGDLVGSTMTIRSDVVVVSSNGAYTITNAHAGTRSVFVWQDFTSDGILNTGDYFGQATGIVINDNSTTSGVLVTVQRYSGSPITPQNVLNVSRIR